MESHFNALFCQVMLLLITIGYTSTVEISSTSFLLGIHCHFSFVKVLKQAYTFLQLSFMSGDEILELHEIKKHLFTLSSNRLQCTFFSWRLLKNMFFLGKNWTGRQKRRFAEQWECICNASISIKTSGLFFLL